MNTARLTRPLSDSMIGQRRAQSLSDARRRSSHVRILRTILIFTLIAAGLNVVIQIVLSSLGSEQEVVISTSGGERIINPRFSGRDELGRPFLVTASSAEREDAGFGIANLLEPTLDYGLLQQGKNDLSSILAQFGVFDEYNRTLLLTDTVKLETKSGYKITTPSALIEMKNGHISGNQGVYGQAPWGAVRADQFLIHEDGQSLELKGRVRTRMIPVDQGQANKEEAQ